MNPAQLLAGIGLSLREVKAEKAKRNMLAFVKFLRLDYQVGLHHKLICERLDLFLQGKIKRLMIFVPPQHGKSELSSRYFPAFILGHRPNAKVAIASYSDELSGSFNRDVQRIIDTDEYRELFPETYLNGYRPAWGGVFKGFQRNESIFEVVGKKGSLRTVGIGTALTGQPVDIAIIDDPVKDRVTAESATERNKVWDWYTDVLSTRLHNDSQQLLLMTRWHDDDLAGRLLLKDAELVKQGEAPEWEVISFPAIKEDVPTELDPRQVGEALWPARHNEAKLNADRVRSGERTWESLYQQRPVAAKGNIIRADKFGDITWAEFAALTQFNYVQWDFLVDPAYTKDADNDASALYCSYFHEATQTIYIKESYSVRMEFPAFTNYLQAFVKRNGYGPFSRIRVEPKASGLSIIQTLKDTTGLNIEAYEYPRIEGTRLDDKDKVTRAFAITPKVDAGRIVLIEPAQGNIDWRITFKAQSAAFPNAKHDDEVDNLIHDVLQRFFAGKKKGVSSN